MTGSPVLTLWNTQVFPGPQYIDLSWTAVPGATRYDAQVGNLGALHATSGPFENSYQTCFGANLDRHLYRWTINDGDAAGAYYLIRAGNKCHAATWDEGGAQIRTRDGIYPRYPCP